jgi:hypothetical protein
MSAVDIRRNRFRIIPDSLPYGTREFEPMKVYAKPPLTLALASTIHREMPQGALNPGAIR